MPVGASNMVIENKKKRYAQNDNQNKTKKSICAICSRLKVKSSEFWPNISLVSLLLTLNQFRIILRYLGIYLLRAEEHI